MKADGSKQTRVTHDAAFDADPAWLMTDDQVGARSSLQR